jgi:hypothetical protein
MSVDARIRQGLTMIEDKLPAVDTVEGYQELHRDIRRTSQHRRARIGAFAAAAVLVATAGTVLLNRGSNANVEPAPPAPTPTVVDDQSDTTQNPYGQQGPLGGFWQTRLLTRTDIAATLRDAGLTRYAEDYAATFPDGHFRLRLTSYAGNFVLRVKSGTHQEAVDIELFQAEGPRLVIRHSGNHGMTTYHWTVVGDQLTLTFVRTSAPGYEGFPAEVRQRALYTTASFVRS